MHLQILQRDKWDLVFWLPRMLLFSSVVAQGLLAFHLLTDALNVGVVFRREPLYGGRGGGLAVSARRRKKTASSPERLLFFSSIVEWLHF